MDTFDAAPKGAATRPRHIDKLADHIEQQNAVLSDILVSLWEINGTHPDEKETGLAEGLPGGRINQLAGYVDRGRSLANEIQNQVSQL